MQTAKGVPFNLEGSGSHQPSLQRCNTVPTVQWHYTMRQLLARQTLQRSAGGHHRRDATNWSWDKAYDSPDGPPPNTLNSASSIASPPASAPVISVPSSQFPPQLRLKKKVGWPARAVQLVKLHLTGRIRTCCSCAISQPASGKFRHSLVAGIWILHSFAYIDPIVFKVELVAAKLNAPSNLKQNWGCPKFAQHTMLLLRRLQSFRAGWESKESWLDSTKKAEGLYNHIIPQFSVFWDQIYIYFSRMSINNKKLQLICTKYNPARSSKPFFYTWKWQWACPSQLWYRFGPSITNNPLMLSLCRRNSVRKCQNCGSSPFHSE